MRKTEMKRSSIVLLFIGILCFTILAVGARQQANQTAASGIAEKKLLLIVKDQPDSPLMIRK